jgi:hypothetical protein
MKKNIFFGTLVLVLALGFWLIGCDNTIGGEIDTWSNITSLSQVNGTWKGSSSETETENGLTIKTDFEMVMVINASEQTAAATATITMTYSGAGVDAGWAEIKETLEDIFQNEELAFNDDNHSITVTQTGIASSITLEDMEGVQINQSGTKMKMPADEDEETPEIIYTKQ